jgi:hypothetical protein
LIPTIIISNGRDLSVDNSNSTNISGYAWYFNDTLISEALYSSYFAIKDGVYKVRYSNPCGIGPASDSLVITTLQNQFIFFDTIPDKVFGDSSFIIHATASSGLPVTYRLENGPATLNNNVITISGAGFVTISALQEGNNKYDAANAARTFKVDKAAAQIHLNNLSQVYDGNPKFPTSTTTPAGLQIEYLFNGAINPPVNAGLYPVIATINDINYYGSLTETFRINKADQVITFASIADKEYGSNPIKASSFISHTY